MSASPAPYRKSATGCVSALTPLLRHLNTGTLAVIMFVALALFSSTRGNEAETKESAPAKVTTTEAITKAGQRTTLGSDLGEKKTLGRTAHN